MTVRKAKNRREEESKAKDNQTHNNKKQSSAGDPALTVETDGIPEGAAEAHGGGEDSATKSAAETDLMDKLAEMQDRYLRLSAEFDNYRKRTLKEKIDLTKTASETLLVRLLPVLDDFERGIKIMETATDCKAMKEGIDLIYNKFKNFLEQSGVKEIEAINQNFDVDLHDAVTKISAPEENLKGKIVDVLEKGYTLNEKVIRFSKVVVGE